MKTTILATAVLLALGFQAHAEVDEPVSSDKKEEAVTKKTDEKVKRTKITGFQDNDGNVGDLEVGVVGTDTVLKFTPDSCKEGSCTKVVVFDKKTANDMNDMKALRDALGIAAKPKEEEKEVLSKAEKLRLAKKLDKDFTTITEKEVREEIALMMSVTCEIDEDSISSGRLGSRDSLANQNLGIALGNTRLAGLSLPEKSPDSNTSDEYKSDAECASKVLKEFMSEHEVEDMSDLKDKLSDLKMAEKEWKLDLRREETAKGREKIQKKLDAVKLEIESVQKDFDTAKKTAAAYDRATTGIAKRLIINPSVSDLATRKFFTAEDFYLHNLAATTPDAFKGVRKAASNSLLDIFRLQNQTHLAFNEMANKTTDPAQKLQFQQAALHYQQAGQNYNAMMSNNTFRGEIAHTASEAGLNPRSILEETFGYYNQGSQIILNDLSKLNLNGTAQAQSNQALPQSLMVQNSDGTYSPVAVVGPNGQTVTTGGVNSRGTRVGANGAVIQIARPFPQAPQITLGSPQGMQTPQPMQLMQPQVGQSRFQGRQ